MENKINLNESELEKVAGGSGSTDSRQRFFIGDKVMLFVYPDYGVGTVTAVQNTGSSWSVVAQFGDNTVTADQSEFIPA